MNLSHVRVFHVVAEHEHVTRAAEALFLSQPAVTKIIQHLEQETGLALFERRGRRIVLTQAGKVLHGYTLQLFALEREMEDDLAVLRDVEVGDVTLAANSTIGVYFLPAVVAQFHRRYPQVELRISILNSHEILDHLLSWDLDFGLVEGDPSMFPPEVEAQAFARDELILVVARGHRWSCLSEVHPAMLQEGELLLRERGSGIREAVEFALRQHGVQVRPLLALPENEAIKQMALQGVGAAMLSRLAVRRELTNGDLMHMPIAGVDVRPQLCLVRRTEKRLSRAAQAFCALLPASVDPSLDEPAGRASST